MIEDGRAEGSSPIEYGEQTAISPTPDIDGTGSGFLLGSVLSTLLKKWPSNVWVEALFLSS